MHSMLAPAEHMLGNWQAEIESLLALQSPLLDRITRGTGSSQEFYRALAVVVWARHGEAALAASGRQVLREWLANASLLGYESQGWAAWSEAMVAFYAGDAAAASSWHTLPDHSLFPDSPLEAVMLRLDQARVRRLAGDTGQAAGLLAEVRSRLAAYADPGRYPEWVAQEEASVGIRHRAPDRRPPGSAVLVVAATEQLSPREQEVLRLLGSEFSLPEVAAHLFVSYNTAKTHTRTIYRKLGVRSRSAAVARGRLLGYVT